MRARKRTVILSAKLYTKYKDDFSASNKEKADETIRRRTMQGIAFFA